MKFRLLDTFSGIGGFSLAASWVWGEELEIHSFIEIDPFCQKVLRKHWPNVPMHDDIRSYKHDGTTVDLIVGGVPCQPASCAGKRKGQDDDRWLWPAAFDIVRQIHPTWCIFENVGGLITLERGLAFEHLLSEMESEGYEVQPFIIPACAVGAPHRRDRVWICAHAVSNEHRTSRRQARKTDEFQKVNRQDNLLSCGIIGTDSHAPHSTNRQNDNRNTRGMGEETEEREGGDTAIRVGNQPLRDSERGQLAWVQDEQIQRGEKPNAFRGDQYVTDTTEQGLQELQTSGFGKPLLHAQRGNWNEHWFEVAQRFCQLDARIPDRLDGRGIIRNKYRVQKLKALGNAIVPQCVMPIMQAIKGIDKL